MLFEKKIEISKWPDPELNKLVEKYLKDDKEIMEDNTNFSGYKIPFKEQNKIMNLITRIPRIEDSKRPTSPFDLYNQEKDVEVRIDISMAAREIIDFLKTIDQELYLYALGLFLGTREDTLRVYDYYDGEKSREVLRKDSCNIKRGTNTDTYVVLGEDIDRETSERLKKIVGLDKCTIEEAMTMMHEIAHSFDRNRQMLSYDIDNPQGRKKFPQITAIYLPEATAIFFETLFGLHLAQKYPCYRDIVENVMRKRLITNTVSAEKTRIKTSLISVYEDKGYVPDTFLAYIKTPESAPGIKEDLIKESSLISSRKYAFAQLFVPTMLKTYLLDRKRGNKRITQYLECCRNNDFDGALTSFEMDIKNQEGLDKLLDNFRDYFIRYKYPQKRVKKAEDRDR